MRYTYEEKRGTKMLALVLPKVGIGFFTQTPYWTGRLVSGAPDFVSAWILGWAVLIVGALVLFVIPMKVGEMFE